MHISYQQAPISYGRLLVRSNVLAHAGVRLVAIGGPMLRLSTERFSAKGLVARQARRRLWMLLLVRYSKQ